jgi:hypothetical protein
MVDETPFAALLNEHVRSGDGPVREVLDARHDGRGTQLHGVGIGHFDLRRIGRSKDGPPACHDRFSADQRRPTGMDARSWVLESPNAFHGAGTSFIEGGVKRAVGGEHGLFESGRHHDILKEAWCMPRLKIFG